MQRFMSLSVDKPYRPWSALYSPSYYRKYFSPIKNLVRDHSQTHRTPQHSQSKVRSMGPYLGMVYSGYMYIYIYRFQIRGPYERPMVLILDTTPPRYSRDFFQHESGDGSERLPDGFERPSGVSAMSGVAGRTSGERLQGERYVNIYVHICIYAYIYTYVHIHTYICLRLGESWSVPVLRTRGPQLLKAGRPVPICGLLQGA